MGGEVESVYARSVTDIRFAAMRTFIVGFVAYSRYSIAIAILSLSWAAASVLWRQIVYGVGA